MSAQTVRAQWAQRVAGRTHCDGSNQEPMPIDAHSDPEYVTTTILSPGGVGKTIMHHHPDYGVCPVCHEPKVKLKSGRMPKHDRYISWADQQKLKEGAKSPEWVKLTKLVRCKLKKTHTFVGDRSTGPEIGRVNYGIQFEVRAGTEGQVVGWLQGDMVPNGYNKIPDTYGYGLGPKIKVGDRFAVLFPDTPGPVPLGEDDIELLDPIPRRKATINRREGPCAYCLQFVPSGRGEEIKSPKGFIEVIHKGAPEGCPMPGKESGIYTFDVTFAEDKDTLKLGETDAGTHRVTVQAGDIMEAQLIAEQMVAATGREPTDTIAISWPEEP